MHKWLKIFFALCLFIFCQAVQADDDYDLLRGYLIKLTSNKNQKDVALLLDVNQSTISRFINHKIETSPKILQKFKDKFPNLFKNPVKRELFKEKDLSSQEKTFVIQCEKFINSGKSKIYLDALKNLSKQDPFQKAPIVIAYRNEGYGGGAFYDHHALQKLTEFPTVISSPDGSINDLKSYVKTTDYALKFGQDFEGRKLPSLAELPHEEGVLVIPGRSRKNECNNVRTEYEAELLKQAFLRGQPVLAICAGAWQLAYSLGLDTKSVKDHCARKMPSIKKNGDIGNNMQIHQLSIVGTSFLKEALGISPNVTPQINSVHWKAIDEESLYKSPYKISVGARSIGGKSEETTVEAIEMDYGAPVFGIQWHPEAYNHDGPDSSIYHINLLKYMAEAGHTYKMKRTLLRELHKVYETPLN